MRILLLMASLLLGVGCGPRHAPGSAAARPTGPQVETFTYAWQRVAELAPDATPDGHIGEVDWRAAHAELLPRAAAARTPADLRPVLEELLGRLHRSHYTVVPRTPSTMAFPKADGAPGDLGFALLPVDDALLVWRVAPGTDAAAQLAPGDRLLQLGPVDLEAMAADLLVAYPDAPARREDALWLRSLVQVADGQRVALEVEAPSGERRSVVVTAGPLRGALSGVGSLPPQPVTITRTTSPSGVPVLHTSAFLLPALTAFERAVTDARQTDAPGLVLDLRGNTGGVVQLARGFAGWILSQPVSLGEMTMGGTHLTLAVHPRPAAQRFGGPVAVLVDRRTMSTSEVLAAGLQELGRVRVFGEQTPGRCLPSFIEALPNGDLIQLAFGDLTTPSGRRVEGTGVTPDVAVPVTREALVAGADPALEAALAWIADASETP